jgi:hypothetical protein
MSRWREVIWTDENNKEVKRLACHESELDHVLNMPFPTGAVVREPVYELTNINSATKFQCRYHYRVGDTFYDHINQGDRFCRVVAVDEESGDFMYEYEMPGGRTFLRNQNGKPISEKRIPRKFAEVKLNKRRC